MWIISISLTITLTSCVLARPQAPQSDVSTTPVAIISESETIGPDGSFSYSYETGNGIKVEESGVQKPNPNPGSEDGDDTIQVLNGLFTYTAPDGTRINLRYIADENSFQPSGDHLPTPPPIPEEIQKSLALLPQSAPSTDVPATPNA